jgi:hypothetical protein
MASIAGALARIKRDPLGAIDRSAIERSCRELGYDWRDRELDPTTTLALFVQQVLQGNVPCSEVRHLAGPGVSFTASAYCQARARLPLSLSLSLYQAMLTRAIGRALSHTRRDDQLWHGHRVFHVDGSTFSMPDTPELQKAFGQPGAQAKGCGFPVAHLLVLFHAQTGLLLDAWASPLRTGDMSQAAEVHAHLSRGDVLIGDDAFSTYAHLALLLLRSKLHGLFPVHHRRIVDFTRGRAHTVCGGSDEQTGLPRSRWIKSLGREDQLVEYFKPVAKPLWMKQSDHDLLPDSIIVRELRRTVQRPGLGKAGKATLTIVTTLLDPVRYPADELMLLRLRRWDVETDLRHLKITMRMDVLRCKTEAGVRKELCVFCLVYNLVRVTMLVAAARQHVRDVSRISFADTLHWMRHARPGDRLPPIMLVPHRPNRAEPRCRKRRPKEYDLMNKPRDVLRKRLKNQGKAA